jgi:hypothetical protein
MSLTLDGSKQCEKRMSGSPIQAYRFLREGIISQCSRRTAGKTEEE